MEMFVAAAIVYAAYMLERGLSRIADVIENLSFEEDEEESGG